MWDSDLSAVSERLLLVDDDLTLRVLLKRHITAFGLQADLATNGREAVALLEKHDYGVVITDMVMPEMDGMELIRHIRRFHPHCDVLVISGYTKLYSFSDLISAGASDFIGKPFARDELQAKLQRVFRERHLITELHQATAAAEVASQAKSDFLHTISHELRTPMNGILGFASLLREVKLDDSYANYVEMINISAERLMDLVNQILNYSNLDTRPQDFRPELFSLPELLENVLTIFQARLAAKGVELEVEIPDDFPPQLRGDAEMLGLVVKNLLDNAVKFTTQGRIVLTMATVASSTKQFTVQLDIRDTGCGVPQAKQELIFEPFSQSESYKTRRNQGAGLGLAICTKLVTMMGGDIWLRSKVNEGTTVSFTAQLAVP